MTISTQRGPGSAGPPLRRRRGPRLFRVRDWRVRTKLGAPLTIPPVAVPAPARAQNNTTVHKAESLQHLPPLQRVRAGVQAGWLRQAAVFAAYTKSINNLLALLPSESQVGSGGQQLAHTVRGLNTLALAKELTDQVRGRLFALIISGQLDP